MQRKPISIPSLPLLCLLSALSGCSSKDSADTAAWTATSDAGNAPKVAPSTSSSQPSKPTSSAGTQAAPSRVEDGAHATAALTTLQWKRASALEADLSRALELAPDTVCREFGTASCVRDVHLVPLGGSNPFTTGMFEPAAEPLASTPTVVERIVLSACSQRAELDRKAGSEAKVFRQTPLDKDAPLPDTATNRALVTELFQRLLSRDPSQEELTSVSALARDDSGKAISASDFAKLACFTIGSSAEFLFF